MSSLKEKSFGLTEYMRVSYTVNLEAGIMPEDLLKPSFWSNVSYKLKPLDLVEVRAEDGSYYGQLLVRDRGRSWAKVEYLPGFPMLFKDITEVPAMVVDEYSIVWKGPQYKFRVMRISDNHVMKDGFTDKEAARKWVIEHMKALEK
jgi:hypothetical protein